MTDAKLATKTFWSPGSSATCKDHLVRNLTIEIPANPGLKLYGRPGETADDVRAALPASVADEAGRCRDRQAARQVRGQGHRAARSDRGRRGPRRRARGAGDAASATPSCCRRPARSSAGCSAASRSRGGLLGKLGTAASRRGTTKASERTGRRGREQGRAARRRRSRSSKPSSSEEVTEIDARWMALAKEIDHAAGRAREDRCQGRRTRAGLATSRLMTPLRAWRNWQTRKV